MIGAIPPPALSGSGSRVECFLNIPLSLELPGSPCVFLSITMVGYPVKQTRFFSISACFQRIAATRRWRQRLNASAEQSKYAMPCLDTDTLKHKYHNFADMQKYQNFWRQSDFPDILDQKIPTRIAIRITFDAPHEKCAIHREYLLAYAFHDH